MGILKRFFNASTITLTGWDGVNRTANSPITVTKENSILLPVVYAAINVKSSSLGKLPLHVYQRTDNGRERIMNHPVSYLLGVRPNPLMTPYTFFHTIITMQNMFGLALVRMEFKGGRVNALYLLHPETTEVRKENGKIYYTETLENGSKKTYTDDEVIRLPYLTQDGFTPLSPIEVAMDTIGQLKAQSKFANTYFSNGALTKGALEIDQTLSPEAKKKIRNEFEKMNTGVENWNRVAVFDGGIKYKSLQLPLDQVQFIETQNWGIRDVCRVFNVPPHLVQDLQSTNYSTLEQQSLAFIENTISPIATLIEQEMTYKLFTDNELEKGYYVEFNLTAGLRSDSVARSAYYKTMLESGIYNINEIRTLENLNGIGPAGDKHRVDLNHVSVDIADEYQMNKSNSGQS